MRHTAVGSLIRVVTRCRAIVPRIMQRNISLYSAHPIVVIVFPRIHHLRRRCLSAETRRRTTIPRRSGVPSVAPSPLRRDTVSPVEEARDTASGRRTSPSADTPRRPAVEAARQTARAPFETPRDPVRTLNDAGVRHA